MFVTHGLGFLPQCDRIIVMVDGRVSEVGTYNELIEQDLAFAEYLRNYDEMNMTKEEEATAGIHMSHNYLHCNCYIAIE